MKNRIKGIRSLILAILLIILLGAVSNFNNRTLQLADSARSFPGNNGYGGYLETDTKGYSEIEGALVNSIKKRKKKHDFDKLNSLSRMVCIMILEARVHMYCMRTDIRRRRP